MWGANSPAGGGRSRPARHGTPRCSSNCTSGWWRGKPTEQVPPGLAHGDYRFDNVVLDEQFSVAAVLDWELCTIGDPIADFAWSLEYWANENDPVSFLRDPPTAADIFVTREEVVDRYRSRCGFEVGDLSYYRVFSWWKQACIAEGALARQIEAARRGQTGPRSSQYGAPY